MNMNNIETKCVDPNAPTEKCVVCDSYLYKNSEGLWICNKCQDEYFQENNRKWYDNIEIKYFHPFNFIFYKGTHIDTSWHPSDDVREYGFSLDLTTEMYYYTYDWGYGFNLRLLGFGFEIVKVGK